MVSLNEWCERHREFYFKLKRYNETLNPYVGKDTFYKISEFIENNKQFLDGNKEAGVLLSSIGAKVCFGVTKDPLNLQKHIKRLLPSNRELVKGSEDSLYRQSDRPPAMRH